MKYRPLISFIALFLASVSIAQNPFVGQYEGTYNGDKVTLNLQAASGNNLTGKMFDSAQNYDVAATYTGNQLKGTAVEKTLSLTFNMSGILQNKQLTMQLVLNYNGQTAKLDFILNKIESNTAAIKPDMSHAATKIQFPTGASHDSNVIGRWTKNETYNSGYGDNFMGANFQQSMIFFGDGSVGDGGSSASISGSNYSGYSSGVGKSIKDVYWYTQGNQLYLYAVQNGKAEKVLLGKYYVENGRMLITGTNNTKLLLTKN